MIEFIKTKLESIVLFWRIAGGEFVFFNDPVEPYRKDNQALRMRIIQLEKELKAKQ